MAPSVDHEDNVQIAEDDLSTLDDALGGARRFILSGVGHVWGSHRGSNPRPLAIDEDTGTPDRPTGLRASIRSLAQSVPNLTPKDIFTLLKVGEAAALQDPINDRDYVMEGMIRAAVDDEAGLIGGKITQKFVTELWNDLPHPPDNYLAGEFRFRQADGSNNSVLHPNLGAAGQAYARTVKPTNVQGAVLPDPGVLFDTLMARRDPQKHPTKISSMLFYLATVIIHDLFRTDHDDFSYSKTSSYLDLAPLYGSNAKELEEMRLRLDGKLKPDCFSETRLLMLPPGSAILLIMFNRFHNHVAEQLYAINERGRFTKPLQKDYSDQNRPGKQAKDFKPALVKWEDELFQTARLITCGLYVNIILIDYVRTILNLNRTDSDWQLNPRIDIPDGPAIGVGNQVSAEFNLVYRWHATVSERDEQWTKDEFARLFPGQDIENIPLPDFLKTLGIEEAKLSRTPPEKRPFQAFKRKENGYYDDDQLVQSLIGSVDDCANAYGPRQVPTCLKAVEVLGIQQARAWNLATLNEFRKYFSLKPHETFEDITTDPETAKNLKNLYKHPNNVELYPGLVVEDAKKDLAPASGLCPSYTVSRAVLADATVLVRGDRFYTTSYHPRILTNWGFGEAQFDLDVDNGCCFYKLFQRSYPHHFHPDSVYTHYPLTISKEVKKILGNELVHRAPLYNTDEAKSTITAKTHIIDSGSDARAIIKDTDSYDLDLSLAIKLLTPSKRSNSIFLKTISKHLQIGPSSCRDLSTPALLVKLCNTFEDDLSNHLKSKAYTLGNFREVDIVHSVVNKTTLRLAAELFDIPTKAFPKDGRSPVDENELLYIFKTLSGTWTGFDRPTLTLMRQKSAPLVKALRHRMDRTLSDLVQKLSKGEPKYSPSDSELTRYRLDVLYHLIDSFSSSTKLGDLTEAAFAASLILAASLATTISTRFAELLDTLLALPGSKHLDAIRALSTESTAKADKGFNAYANELIHLSSTATSVRIAAANPPTAHPSVPPGDILLLLSSTDTSSTTTTPDLNRNAAHYLPIDRTFGAHDPIWQALHLASLRSLLKLVCGGLPGLRPARIWNGQLASVPSQLKRVPVRLLPAQDGPLALQRVPEGKKKEGAEVEVQVVEKARRSNERWWAWREKKEASGWVYLTENWDARSPVPESLKVNFDIEQ